MRRLFTAMIGLAAIGCALGEQTVAPTRSLVVMHAVLNPGASTQVVLLERSRSGAVTSIYTVAFNSTDPIAVSGGIPVSRATVELSTPSGAVLTGVEGVAQSGRGTGVYRFALDGASLVPGGAYALRIHTLEGDELSASTTVPSSEATTVAPLQLFDRDGDTIIVKWKAVAGARSYLVRVDSPLGPFFMFTDTTHLRLVGELRNLFTAGLPHLFIPGFQQSVSIAAVDSNFYDYYRTQNDPFTGSGIISRVKGGIGLFGAAVVVDSRMLDVIVRPRDPIEGLFTWKPSDGETGTPPALDMRLYAESRAARSDAASGLSGNYNSGRSTNDASAQQRFGLLGSLVGRQASIALLRGQLVYDTASVFTGELRGDSLIGTFPPSVQRRVYLRSR